MTGFIENWGTAVALALLAFAQPSAVKAEGGECADILPNAQLDAMPRRGLAAQDLIRLRDIGPADLPFPDMKLVSLSPYGERVAFQIRRADPKKNGYCLAMVVVDMRQRSAPIVVDRGGSLIRMLMEFRPSPVFPTGIPLAITPQWSPDGKSIFFLKRIGTFTQVWRADALGAGSMPVTSAAFDIEDFALDAPGTVLIISGRPGIGQANEAIDEEGLSGFHLDDRYAPTASKRPFPGRPIATERYAVELSTGTMRPASSAEGQILERHQALPGSQLAPVFSRKGRTARFNAEPGNGLVAKLRLAVATDTGQALSCDTDACVGRLSRASWDGDTLRFFRREDPVASVTSLYEWTPGGPPPRRIFSTNDLLIDCQPADALLLCLREGSTQPRRIELLDPRTGNSRVVFDPNPNFSRLDIGTVERITWRNAFDVDTIGDLVYPVGYRRGHRYPLIIVQYDTRGFLRGGVGDEFPIQAFANRDYAVLSFSRPTPFAMTRGASDVDAINRGNLAGFADRRSVLSSLEVVIDSLAERGIIDRAKVGITGLSDGGSTVEFGLINSSLFAVAASSSCCWDSTMPARVGPAGARHFKQTGYPGISEYRPDFWDRISLVNNASRIRAPILLQMADDEYLSALPGYTALREHSVPVDLYVFPDEHHVKWQPAHKLAIYERSVDWFDYWLKGVRSDAPERKRELDHWDELRAEATSYLGTPRADAPSQ